MKKIFTFIPGTIFSQSEYYYNHWCQAYGKGVNFKTQFPNLSNAQTVNPIKDPKVCHILTISIVEKCFHC